MKTFYEFKLPARQVMVSTDEDAGRSVGWDGRFMDTTPSQSTPQVTLRIEREALEEILNDYQRNTNFGAVVKQS